MPDEPSRRINQIDSEAPLSGEPNRRISPVDSNERIAPGMLAGFIGVFAPQPRSPDYVLTLATQESGPLRDVSHEIKRHGDWLRDDKIDGLRRITRHVHLPTGTVVEAGSNPDGPIKFMQISRPTGESASRIDYRNFKAGKSDIVAGEPCDVWIVYRGMERGEHTFTRFGCVTADGIELSHHTLSRSGTEVGYRAAAVSLARRPVSATEVEPPDRKLDLDPWLAGSENLKAIARDEGDFEVVLEAEGGRAKRIIRRHGKWRYEAQSRPDGSSDYRTFRADGAVSIFAQIDPTNRPERVTVRTTPAAPGSKPVRQNAPPSKLLGLECTWFDSMPRVSDASLSECRTNDGITLIAREEIWSSLTTFKAVRVSRRRLQMADVLPPPELLDLETWAVR